MAVILANATDVCLKYVRDSLYLINIWLTNKSYLLKSIEMSASKQYYKNHSYQEKDKTFE